MLRDAGAMPRALSTSLSPAGVGQPYPVGSNRRKRRSRRERHLPAELVLLVRILQSRGAVVMVLRREHRVVSRGVAANLPASFIRTRKGQYPVLLFSHCQYVLPARLDVEDRKSTRLNSSH